MGLLFIQTTLCHLNESIKIFSIQKVASRCSGLHGLNTNANRFHWISHRSCERASELNYYATGHFIYLYIDESWLITLLCHYLFIYCSLLLWELCEIFPIVVAIQYLMPIPKNGNANIHGFHFLDFGFLDCWSNEKKTFEDIYQLIKKNTVWIYQSWK